MAVESAEGPVEARNIESSAEAGTDCTFGNAAGEVCGTHSGADGQPGKWLEFVVKKVGYKTSRGMLAVGKWGITAAVVENRTDKFGVMLVEAVEAGLKIVPGKAGIEGNLATDIS